MLHLEAVAVNPCDGPQLPGVHKRHLAAMIDRQSVGSRNGSTQQHVLKLLIADRRGV